MCKFKENCPCYDEDYCRNKTTSDERCTATLIIKVNGNRYIKGDIGAEKPEQHVRELTAMQEVINARDERVAELEEQVKEKDQRIQGQTYANKNLRLELKQMKEHFDTEDEEHEEIEKGLQQRLHEVMQEKENLKRLITEENNERITELQGQVDELIKTNENYKEYIASEVKTHGETERQLEQCKDLIKAIKYMCKTGG